MSREYGSLRTLVTGTLVALRYEVFDVEGASGFVLDAGSVWKLYSSVDGSQVGSGTLDINNSDTSKSGRAIKSISALIDLASTDMISAVAGAHYLVFTVLLTNGQIHMFRIPSWIVNFTTKGLT